MFPGNRLVALCCVVLSLSVNTVAAQSLGSPAALLDALKQRRGDVVLAFIDSPADQGSPLRNIQGLLSVYEVTLNGEELGSIRRNSVLHVRPRLGLNRLVIRDAFDPAQSTEVSFPAMRSAGVSTSIVEIRTSREFNWIEALLLNGREVQAIEDALTRDKTGGMARVLKLIRSRGHEPVKAATKRVNWGRGVTSVASAGDSHADSGSDSDSGDSTTVASLDDAASSESAVSASTESTATDATDATADASSEAASETTESESSVSVSADRRSYY